jgi:hypothetical protein
MYPRLGHAWPWWLVDPTSTIGDVKGCTTTAAKRRYGVVKIAIKSSNRGYNNCYNVSGYGIVVAGAVGCRPWLRLCRAQLLLLYK